MSPRPENTGHLLDDWLGVGKVMQGLKTVDKTYSAVDDWQPPRVTANPDGQSIITEALGNFRGDLQSIPGNVDSKTLPFEFVPQNQRRRTDIRTNFQEGRERHASGTKALENRPSCLNFGSCDLENLFGFSKSGQLAERNLSRLRFQ